VELDNVARAVRTILTRGWPSIPICVLCEGVSRWVALGKCPSERAKGSDRFSDFPRAGRGFASSIDREVHGSRHVWRVMALRKSSVRMVGRGERPQLTRDVGA
jgi:hypothetical protein